MARKNPLGTIKDVAVGTAKGGVGLGLSVAGQVASKATDTVTSLIPGRKESTAPTPDLEPAVPAAESRKSQGDALAPVKTTPTEKPATAKAPIKKAPAKKSPAKKASASAATPQVEISPDKPVNVTKELGLDAAPVSEPAPSATPEPKPVTEIDAAADASAVDVTPADIAPAKKAPAQKAAAKKATAKKAPEKKVPAKKAPEKKVPAKKAPARKSPDSSPGDKLPPRTT